MVYDCLEDSQRLVQKSQGVKRIIDKCKVGLTFIKSFGDDF